MINSHKVAILIPSPMRQRILSDNAEQRLCSMARVIGWQRDQFSAAELPALLEGVDICLTGWGTPGFNQELLARCPDLRFVAHTAGSIRHLLPAQAFQMGMRVSQAAAIIADAVAEFVIAQALLCLRHLHLVDQAMHMGQEWNSIRSSYPGRLLGSQVVGIVGAGRVGQAVIRLFRAFGCRTLVYDPYLSSDVAAHLQVELVSLEQLFQTVDLVSLHAPVLPETERMVTGAHLAMLHDGAIFLNAGRSTLVDAQALTHELERGRLVIALDVFEEEPLPVESLLRTQPVLLSPHIAGQSIETYLRQGDAMVDEIERWITQQPLRYEVSAEMYAILA